MTKTKSSNKKEKKGKSHNSEKQGRGLYLGFLALLVLLLTASILLPDQKYSLQERRSLAQFPKADLKTIANGSFQQSLEDYLLDQIAFRSSFLQADSLYNQIALQKRYDHDIFSANGYLFKPMTAIDYASLNYAAGLFTRIYEQYLKESHCSIYLSIIPDKAYYLNNPRLLEIDYQALINQMVKNLSFASYIDITQSLSLKDYYYSDSHWRQENLEQLSSLLLEKMHIESDFSFEKENRGEFTGVYGSQSSLFHQQDYLITLNDPALDLKITDYSSGRGEVVDYYQPQGENGDPYHIYLGGSKGLQIIENEKAQTDRELIVFRDSYASSLAIYLAKAYKKITLIDLRNFSSLALNQYVHFQDQDVLFLYSMAILNNSYQMR